MPVADLQSWANDVQDIRLPAIESDISTLQTDQLNTQTQLTQKSQELTDALAAHTAQIAAAQTDATTALAESADTTTRVYDVDLAAQAYTNQKIQELRDELNLQVGLINAYMTGDLEAYIDSQVSANVPALQSVVDAAVGEAQQAASDLEQDITDINAVNDTITNTELPAIHQTQSDFQNALTIFDDNWTQQFTDYPYANVLDGLNDTRALIAGEMAPLGHEIPRLPLSNWTQESASAVLDPKTPALPDWFITDDPVFLDCAELPAGADVTLGQSYPADFNKDRVYKVTVRLRVVDDGTLSGVQLALGATTWEGNALVDQNVERTLSVANATVADGAITFECYFSGNLTAMQDAGYSVGPDPADNAVHLSTAGDPTKAFFHIRQNAGGTTDGQIRVALLKVEDVSGLTAESVIRQDAIASIDGKLAAGIMMRVKAGTAGAQLELIAANDPDGATSLARISADDIVLDGTVSVQQMNAEVFSADNIVAGQMSVQHIYVDELLSIDVVNAGFSIGKVSAYDSENDGIYMGRALEADGSTGFGLAVAKTDSSGLKQTLRATKADGLRLSNARFFRELSVPSNFASYNNSTSFDIAPGTQRIDIEMIGGGGGGGGGSNGFLAGSFRGSDGGDTTVVLKDGTTTIDTWVASGGNRSNNGFIYATKGERGQASPYGNGGAGGDAFIQAAPAQLPTNGADASNAGAGGGGGGDNFANYYRSGKKGWAGQFKEITDYDISSLVDPKIEITVGSGGSGYSGSTGSRKGGNGADGLVKIREIATAPTPADVIPLRPTYAGTINNPSNNPTLPDYGAGMWVLYTSSGADLDMGNIEIDDEGTIVRVNGFGSLTFISSKTPVWTSGGSSGQDIVYRFYKMGPS